MEEVVCPSNLKAALQRVKQNKGSSGIDGMSLDELPAWLWANWQRLREALLAGTYRPSPVRRQTIPKRGGGERELGIPTVVDRLVQQAMLQVLQPRFDPGFSDHSYGFRPGRRAHDAVRRAQGYVQEGRRWVVDVDLAKFFDRVNHDVLMGKLEARIGDTRMLGLIRRYLDAGVMVSGVVIERHEGTPQGGPLSPLLANVLLDEVDKELERRRHAFVRYADDCNVYVRSRRAGERVLVGLRTQYARLRLQVNEAKSAVDLAVRRTFLGFSFFVAAEGRIKVRVAGTALGAMKANVRELSNRNRGRSVPTVVADLAGYLNGWREYFRLADTPGVFRDLDQWIRHRLRCLQLKQWKRGRTVFRELRARGMSVVEAAQVAANTRRWWHNSALKLNFALPTRHFDRLGLPRLAP
jgi:group II intron reverse transcriptase/maturase